MTCEQCGGEYAPRVAFQRFCNEKCERRWLYLNPKHPPATCGHCAKTFIPKEANRNKFCSRECAFTHKTEHSKGRAPYVRRSCVVGLTCSICAKAFMGRAGTKYCYTCRTEHGNLTTYVAERYTSPGTLECVECGKAFTPCYGDKHRTFCSDDCSEAKADRVRRAAERAKRRGCTAIEYFDPKDVFKGNDWTCGICGKPMLGLGTFPDPSSPSLDHINPIGEGGQHTRDNARGAHLYCNWARRYAVWTGDTPYHWQAGGYQEST